MGSKQYEKPKLTLRGNLESFILGTVEDLRLKYILLSIMHYIPHRKELTSIDWQRVSVQQANAL